MDPEHMHPEYLLCNLGEDDRIKTPTTNHDWTKLEKHVFATKYPLKGLSYGLA